MEEKVKASLFTNGGSQAVRLPKEFRFAGTHVFVRREGDAVVLEPIRKAQWPPGHWERLESLGPVSDDFAVPTPLPESPHRDRMLAAMDDAEVADAEDPQVADADAENPG